jgi:TetR/AcrR family transcriptional repressor of nem operon
MLTGRTRERGPTNGAETGISGNSFIGAHRSKKWDMMIIMKSKSSKPGPLSRKEATHERIVEVASRAIRRSGYDGTGVADIMKEAGLTHGGFYAHFESRTALLAEAGDRAGAEAVAVAARVAAAAPPGQAIQAIMQAYLSQQHVEAIENGCPVCALGSEMPRQAPEVRRAATIHIKEMIDLVARQLPNWGEPQAHEQAMALISALIGTTMLARAVDDPKLSQALRTATMNQLSPAAD